MIALNNPPVKLRKSMSLMLVKDIKKQMKLSSILIKVLTVYLELKISKFEFYVGILRLPCDARGQRRRKREKYVWKSDEYSYRVEETLEVNDWVIMTKIKQNNCFQRLPIGITSGEPIEEVKSYD